MILAFFWVFQQISVVAHLVDWPWSTVRNFIARACARESTENKQRTGLPRKIDDRTRLVVLRAARQNREWTRQELRDFHAPHVSIDTVDRILQEANIRKWIAKKRVKLTPEHAKKRLEWALVRRHWEVADFEGIVYSDECSIEKSQDPKQKCVFRSPQEKWLP